MEDRHTSTDAIREQLMAAVTSLDGVGVRRAFDRSLQAHGVEDTVVDVAVPVLHEVGLGWQSGRLGVVHEHFASTTFRGVLTELRAPVPDRRDRTVVLGCPPRELHDLPLELFGAMLHARRWRTVSLGANTPIAALAEAVRFLQADACVLAGVRPAAFASRGPSLARLGGSVPLFLAGQGALALIEPPLGVVVLPADFRAAAHVVDQVPISTDRADALHSASSGIR
ncbi:MAG: B12-binding domain-containing protein [Ornithinibacter sp.]